MFKTGWVGLVETQLSFFLRLMIGYQEYTLGHNKSIARFPSIFFFFFKWGVGGGGRGGGYFLFLGWHPSQGGMKT